MEVQDVGSPSSDLQDTPHRDRRSLMKERKIARRVTVGTLFVGVALAASVAFAAWTASGSGSGYAKAKTAQALTTVDVSASTTAQLYPGGTGDVIVKITNPNPYAVTVTGLAGAGTITSDKGAMCDAATGVTYTAPSSPSLAVAAGASTQFTLTGAVAMSNSSANACQGAVFTIPVTLTGTS
jgi:hypothetical protein